MDLKKALRIMAIIAGGIGILLFLIVGLGATYLLGYPDRISVDADDQECRADADCAYVHTTCSGCECYGTPVNAAHKEKYEARRKLLCSISSTGSCDMMCSRASLHCVDRQCISISAGEP